MEIECDFDIKRAEASNIPTNTAWGLSERINSFGEPTLIRYAICPVCSKVNQHFGWFRKLSDAQACRDGHSILAEENKLLEASINRQSQSRDSLLHSLTMLMGKFALVSKSKLIAQWFTDYCGIDAIILNDVSDLWQAEGRKILFLGKPSNYLTHPVLKDPEVRAELERQERIRDSEYAMIQEDKIVLMDEWEIEGVNPDSLYRRSEGETPSFDKIVKSNTDSPPKKVRKSRSTR